MEGQDHHHKLTPLIIPRSEHPISRKMMSEEALKVLYRLHRHGFTAYLVGGSVRDLLLGRVPKDFDVATNAHPQEINTLFKNSRIIGRRFRLVQVFFRGGKIVEVSTFRSRSKFEEIETEEGNTIRKREVRLFYLRDLPRDLSCHRAELFDPNCLWLESRSCKKYRCFR